MAEATKSRRYVHQTIDRCGIPFLVAHGQVRNARTAVQWALEVCPHEWRSDLLYSETQSHDEGLRRSWECSWHETQSSLAGIALTTCFAVA